MQSPISIFIICQDEQAKIEACLKQASKIADEIVILDSGSTDKTKEIAAKYTDKIYHQDWLGYGAQKNAALEKCCNEWVMNLDADEVITNELVEEIKKLNLLITKVEDKKTSLDYPGYQIARKLFIGDKEIKHGGYYPDYQLRLFKKSIGRFCTSLVHESVELKNTDNIYSKDRSNCPKLKNPLNHYAYQDLAMMQKAFEKYAKLSTKKSNLTKAIFNYIFSFINKFIFRLGFLHGILGLRLALTHAKYSFEKYRQD